MSRCWVGVGACTLQNNPPQTAAGQGASPAGIPTLPRQIERDVGSAYPDPALQAYVDRVGQQLVARSNVAGTYRFLVLDLPVANAHAVGSYVFVTRGLLALLDDEAELAAALSHEVGHLVERHGTQRARARQGVVDAAIDAAVTTGSAVVGRSVAREGLLGLAPLFPRAGARGRQVRRRRAGAGRLSRRCHGQPDRQAAPAVQLELQLLGEAPDSIDRRSTTSTHPAPIERREALVGIADASAPGQSRRPEYLAAIDGMSVDDPPSEGFVRGNRFLHPLLKVGFEVPRDFRLFNDTDGVLGIGRDRSLLFFSCTEEPAVGPLADWMRNRLKPTPTDIQTTEIGGAEAAIGAKPRGSDAGLGQIRYVLIRHGDRVCFFNLLSDGPDRDRRIDVLVAAARTFHTLTDAEAAALRPYRLRVISPDGLSAAQLAQRLPYPDFRMERLLVLNGVDNAADLGRQSQVKLIGP